MIIYSLMENTPYAPSYAAEHGLSLYIETAKHKILFDFGQTAAFASNAARLGLDLRQVDVAILSHGHYDHGGGIAHFLEVNTHAPLYLSRYAFEEHYNADNEKIGLDPRLKGNDRFVFTEDVLKLDDEGELELCSCNHDRQIYVTDSAGLIEKHNGMLKPDRFRHEQYLVVREDGKKVVVSGCSHKGILNIMQWLRPDVLIGGFHFMKQDLGGHSNPVLDGVAQELSTYDTIYYTGHCTGVEPFGYLKEKMGEKLNYLASGQVITI